MLLVRNYHLKMAKPIRQGRTHPLVGEDVTQGPLPQEFSWKRISGRESQGAWRQDELISGKTASRKVTLNLTLNWYSTRRSQT
jgi:hypothetical protein